MMYYIFYSIENIQ